MTNHMETCLKKGNRLSFFLECYRTYRCWKKDRGRRKKTQKHMKRMLGLYSQFITKGDLCFDIRANEGNRTEAFLKLGAMVVAVEPQGQCLHILREKFGNDGNIHIVPKALDKVVSEKQMYICDASTLSTMSDDWINSAKETGRFGEVQWNKKVTVQTTTFDRLIEKFGSPVFSKIDVEGFEYNVLSGLSQLVQTISFEFVPELIELTIKCIRHLEEIGYNNFNYSQGESMALRLSDWLNADDMIDYLAEIPADGKLFGDVYAGFSAN